MYQLTRIAVTTSNISSHHTSRYFSQCNLFEILSNQPEIRLHLPFSGWFGSNRTSVWIQINRKIVYTICFRFDYFSFHFIYLYFHSEYISCFIPSEKPLFNPFFQPFLLTPQKSKMTTAQLEWAAKERRCENRAPSTPAYSCSNSTKSSSEPSTYPFQRGRNSLPSSALLRRRCECFLELAIHKKVKKIYFLDLSKDNKENVYVDFCFVCRFFILT